MYLILTLIQHNLCTSDEEDTSLDLVHTTHLPMDISEVNFYVRCLLLWDCQCTTSYMSAATLCFSLGVNTLKWSPSSDCK